MITKLALTTTRDNDNQPQQFPLEARLLSINSYFITASKRA